MTFVKSLLISIVSLSILVGCTAKESGVLKKETAVNAVQDSVRIKPGGSYEECLELQPGQAFDYSFDASNFVNFNVHYHGLDKVHYPVNDKGIMMGKGTIDPSKHDFYVEDNEFFCLMWDNLNDMTIEVSFSCVLRDK